MIFILLQLFTVVAGSLLSPAFSMPQLGIILPYVFQIIFYVLQKQ